MNKELQKIRKDREKDPEICGDIILLKDFQVISGPASFGDFLIQTSTLSPGLVKASYFYGCWSDLREHMEDGIKTLKKPKPKIPLP